MTTLDLSRMGFGITGTLDLDIVRQLAPRVEQAGFRTLWVNHGGGGDSLASIEVAASVTKTLHFGTGVIPVDRLPAAEIVSAFRAKRLPADRVSLGIGASTPPSPLTSVREAAAILKHELDVPIFVGALGPKMRRMAVQEADGVLLNWLTPDGARAAIADKEHDLAAMPDKDAVIALYIRCALGESAYAVLKREADRYQGIPSYAANFRRLGFTALESAVHATTPEGIREGLAQFMGTVDEPVIRAITASDALEEYFALIDAVADAV
jgi:alkanesulfonate monooxygenase SsuD/methylene tetrahydromethanopterin reductase-like flavin-dependent oxidoreductase (luciferase family)